MAKLSNSIEDFINELLEQANGALEIQRALIAEQFDCSPSQINYVLTTRFTPYKGYYVESRRGGGGYIRIVKVQLKNREKARDLFNDVIGNSITKDKSDLLVEELLNQEKITRREAEIIKVALCDRSLGNAEDRNELRANVLKNILLVILS